MAGCAGWLDNSTMSIKDILCLSPGEWGALIWGNRLIWPENLCPLSAMTLQYTHLARIHMTHRHMSVPLHIRYIFYMWAEILYSWSIVLLEVFSCTKLAVLYQSINYMTCITHFMHKKCNTECSTPKRKHNKSHLKYWEQSLSTISSMRKHQRWAKGSQIDQ